LGAGLQRAGGSLDEARKSAGGGATAVVERLVREAARTAASRQATSDERVHAVRLLGYDCGARAAGVLNGLLLDRQQGEAVQMAAVEALGRFADVGTAMGLIQAWHHSTPQVQDQITVALGSRAAWSGLLLDACGSGRIAPGRIPRATRVALLASRDSALRERAQKVFGDASSSRAEVIARYQSALSLPGDVARVSLVYERVCMQCHRLGERGFQVGPNLALTRNRTPSALLEAILDPNREVPPSFVNYIVIDDSGRTTTGLVVGETAASVTLGHEKGVTETILKRNIEEMTSTGMSLMPEGLEKLVDPQNIADLLAFLADVHYDIGTLPDFAQPGK
jgi:putative heme-binding domain-containing protein